MAINPAIAELNQKNKEFWRDQQIEMVRRMADDTIREWAFEVMQGELLRLPGKYQTPIELALADSERAKCLFLRQQARAGGKARKTDSLNELIGEIVQLRPAITALELLESLRSRQGEGTIQDIEENTIWFTTRDGRSKPASISGLKDRLSRVKRDLRSR
jgi:hypothetical protein